MVTSYSRAIRKTTEKQTNGHQIYNIKIKKHLYVFYFCVLLNDIFGRGPHEDVEIQDSSNCSVGEHGERGEGIICKSNLLSKNKRPVGRDAHL